MGWRHRHGRRGRNPKPINIPNPPKTNTFTPTAQTTNQTPITLELAEVEAQRLVDLEGLSQEDAGKKMGISRGTVWRLLQSARKKTSQALTEGRPLQIDVNPHKTEEST
ncbi:MAG: DUF134 domain-containing protein [Candidatus Bathyarchaeia archaeon]|jgi:predicted DNA-binding protein (UPF0251 family)